MIVHETENLQMGKKMPVSLCVCVCVSVSDDR